MLESRALLLFGLCLLCACTTEGDLEGSLSDVYRLDHELTRARLYNSELSIEYAREDGSVPVRVTLRQANADLASDRVYDLLKSGAVTGQLADGTEMPPLISGQLKLIEFKAQEGARIRGEFDATLDGVRDTLSLSADFDTTLDVINWPILPEE